MIFRSMRIIPAGSLIMQAVAVGAVLLMTAMGVVPSMSVALASPAGLPAQPELASTRFVIGLERSVDFEVLSLSNPNRVIVELPDVKMRLPQMADGNTTGLVKSFRSGLSAPGKARVVIEVRAPVIVERSDIEKTRQGHQLVLDLAPAVLGKTQAQSKKVQLKRQPPLPRPAPRPEQIAERAYKPVIVIDPGHGGEDTGAVKNGIVEKDAVLAFSKVLRDKLNATGRYRVVMTRDRDVFIPLHERREIAERAEAALFIAVHADYAGSHASGATIYSLRDSTAKALQRSAKNEVVQTVLTSKELATMQGALGDGNTIKTILADLAQREIEMTKERTSTFAQSAIRFMSASTPMRPNADREANFAVLKTAKVPSVLIELAYVTNATDAQNLKSAKWRDRVSDALATAIDNYFESQIARLPM